ncbi:hypothetical protein D9M68_750300 [compost metagenome]
MTLASRSSPTAPSITLRMWAMSRNTKGMLNTSTSGTTGPITPSEMRASWIAPSWACSTASFSWPSTAPGNICTLMRPLVAASSFLPMLSTAATVG